MSDSEMTHPPRESGGQAAQRILWRAAMFAALWWVLAEGRLDGWVLGTVSVALATWASVTLMPLLGHRLSPTGLLRFLGFFIRNSLTGGLQVATMALRGRSALQPAVLEVPIHLPPGGPQILLVNTMNLMPGTLSVDAADGMLRIHVLDERLPIVAEVRALEVVIERMFGSPA